MMRIRSSADFSHMRRGKSIHQDSIRCVYIPNELNHARLGLAVSRKYGSAVQRNRFKRQVRDSFRRHNIREIGVDILIIPLASAVDMVNPTMVSKHLFNTLTRKLEQS